MKHETKLNHKSKKDAKKVNFKRIFIIISMIFLWLTGRKHGELLYKLVAGWLT